jgi:hypothetical protein
VRSEWTKVPGVPMDRDPTDSALYTITLEQDSAAFVFTNGDNDWDKPFHTKHYNIGSAGSYLVQAGEVKQR